MTGWGVATVLYKPLAAVVALIAERLRKRLRRTSHDIPSLPAEAN